MYVEAICPLCFASHVVPEDMRGEKFRCEECEEEFVISKKAKRTSKKPSRPREVKAVDGDEEVAPVEAAEAAEVAEVLPDSQLADKPPKKKARAEDDEEVMEIPDDALQGGAPVLKTKPAPKRRREDDDEEEEERPKKRRREDDEEDGRPKKRRKYAEDEDDRPRKRAPRRKGVPGVLIACLCAGAAFLIGLCGFGYWFAFPDTPEKKAEQAQANKPPANNVPPKAGEKPPPPDKGPPKVNPPKENPPPKKEPANKEPPPIIDLPAGAWAVKADPPAAPTKMPADFKKEIPAPGRNPEITFAGGQSAFVAVGSNGGPGDERQVWNLQTGEMTGKVVGLVPSISHPILSPDGAHLAFQPSAGAVDVRPVGPGQAVSIDLGGSLGPLDLLQFAGPGFLLAGRRFNDKTTFALYNVTTGKREREFSAPLTRSYPADSVAVSPGGAYLALADSTTLRVYDLKTGAPIGQRPLPKENGARSGTCHGLSFSPDGSELAGLFYFVRSPHVIAWDLVRGEVVADVGYPQGRPPATKATAYRGHVIDWVGDRRGWLLFGFTLVDRGKNGTATFLAESPGAGPVPRHLVGSGHVVTMGAGAKAGDKVLMVSTFDPDKPQ
jgi:hypothetical protein